MEIGAYIGFNVEFSALVWPLGALSDHVGRRGLLIGGMLVFAAVYGGLAVADAAWEAYPLLATYGLYLAATDGVGKAFVADHAPAALSGTADSAFSLLAGGCALIASTVAGVVYERVGHGVPFAIGAASARLPGPSRCGGNVARRLHLACQGLRLDTRASGRAIQHARDQQALRDAPRSRSLQTTQSTTSGRIGHLTGQTMRVYRGTPRRRRFLRRLLLALAALFLVVAVSFAFAVWKLHQGLEEVQAANTPADRAVVEETAGGALAASSPITFAIFGVDRRKGDTAPRSDTTILVRLDPRRHTLSQLALTRDWAVPIPGHGNGILTWAYHFGGAALALETIRAQTGIRPNFAVEVDFDSFRRTVDAFDGAYMEIDRRYYNHNTGGATNYTDIDLQPGYQHLRGAAALTFVRFRHSDDDPVRIARQQLFVAAFKRRLDPITTSTHLYELLGIATSSLKLLGRHKASEVEILRWIELARSIPRQNAISVRCDVIPYPKNHSWFSITPSALATCIHAFLQPDTTAATRASADVARPARPGSPSTPIPPSQTIVTEPGRDLGRYQATARAAHLRLYLPSRLPVGAFTRDPQFRQSADPFRVYRVDGHRAVHVTYSYPAAIFGNAAFGFQAIAWSAPPILDAPTASRTFAGRRYDLYLDGARITRIAWHDGGVSYWVSNTLLLALSNETMWSVATSFRPVPKE